MLCSSGKEQWMSYREIWVTSGQGCQEWQEKMYYVIMYLGPNIKYFLLEAGDSSIGKNRTEVTNVLRLGNGLVHTSLKLYWDKLEEN